MYHVIKVDFGSSRIQSLHHLGRVPQFISDTGLVLRSVNHYFRSHSTYWSSNTIRTYAEHVYVFLEWLSSMKASLDECDEHTVAIYADALCARRDTAMGLSWNTIDRRVRAVASMLKWCAQNGYLNVDARTLEAMRARQAVRGSFQRVGHPARAIQTPTRWVTLSKAVDFISMLEKYNDGAHTVRNGLIARLMLEVGLRVSEVAGFSIKQLPEVSNDYDFAVTSIIGKGRKKRLIPIPMRLLRDIHGYVDNERLSIIENIRKGTLLEEALFITTAGDPLSRGWIEKIFNSVSKRCGHKITPHMLRHTFGTYHYHLHKDLPLLRNIMGHSKMETTQFYYVDTAVLEGYSAEYAKLIAELNSFSD